MKLLNNKFRLATIKQLLVAKIFTVETLLQNPNIFQNLPSESHKCINIITNAKHSTLYSKLLYKQVNKAMEKIHQQLKHNSIDVQWIPNYTPIIEEFNKQPGLKLIIGSIGHLFQPHSLITSNKMFKQMPLILDFSRTLTLQEICMLYPEKVPLSYRLKPTPEAIQRISNRLHGHSLEKQPQISDIIIMGSPIMWDQALQVIMDAQKSRLHFWGNRNQKNSLDGKGNFQLGIGDFMRALEITSKLIHKKPLQVIYDLRSYSPNLFLKYLKNKIQTSFTNYELVKIVAEKDYIEEQLSLQNTKFEVIDFCERVQNL